MGSEGLVIDRSYASLSERPGITHTSPLHPAILRLAPLHPGRMSGSGLPSPRTVWGALNAAGVEAEVEVAEITGVAGLRSL